MEEAVVEVAKIMAAPRVGASMPPEYVVVEVLVKRFKPEKVLALASRVEEAAPPREVRKAEALQVKLPAESVVTPLEQVSKLASLTLPPVTQMPFPKVEVAVPV